MVAVQHARGTTYCNHNKIGSSWKETWELGLMRQWPSKCAFEGCDRDIENYCAGAHVIYNGGMYIVPCCLRHNNDNLMDKYGHLMNVNKSMMYPLPDCTCISNNQFNNYKSRVYVKTRYQ